MLVFEREYDNIHMDAITIVLQFRRSGMRLHSEQYLSVSSLRHVR